jgi:hypothetical protein
VAVGGKGSRYRRIAELEVADKGERTELDQIRSGVDSGRWFLSLSLLTRSHIPSESDLHYNPVG